jgi:hypothetical protein
LISRKKQERMALRGQLTEKR